MKGLIIVNQELGHSEYKIKRFQEEAGFLNLELEVLVNDGTLMNIERNLIPHLSVPKADFIIYLDKDYYLAKTLESQGYRLFNKADFIKICDDKLLTYVHCLGKNISVPKTFFAPLFYSESLQGNSYKFLDKVVDELGLPLVAKKAYGSLGESVFKINKKEELVDFYHKYAREPIMFQEDITSSYGKSVRIIIIDGKVFGGYVRTNDKDFRSNFSSSASAEELKDVKFLQYGQQIADKLDIEYAGIDLLYGKNNEPLFCEINSNAFFEIFEEVTKKNVAKAFLEMIIKKVNNE